jgi:hypothetical protein
MRSEPVIRIWLNSPPRPLPVTPQTGMARQSLAAAHHRHAGAEVS